MKAKILWTLGLILFSSEVFSSVYYVAVDGSDSNVGTKEKPFASLNKANDVVMAGDTVWIRGGVYDLNDTVFYKEYEMTAAILLTASGESDSNRIHYFAYPNKLSQIGICSAGENLEYIVECPAGENNSWNLEINLTDDDFVSLEDPSMTVTGQDLSKLPGMLGPRNADGSLPDVDFLKLKANSQMIDKGENVGLPFVGSAPDLGAFEYGMPKSSSSFVESSSSSGTNLLVTNFGGLVEKFGLADVFDLQGRYLGTLQAEQLRDNVEMAIQRKFKKSGVYLLRYGHNIQRVNIK